MRERKRASHDVTAGFSVPQERQDDFGGLHSAETAPVASPLRGQTLLALQRSVGNAAVTRFIVDRPSLQRSPAGQAVINRYRNWGGLNLREEALGAELAGMLPVNPTLVSDVLWTLPDDDRDDVSVALVEAVPNLADLVTKARGCEWLFRQMVVFLQEGETENDEAAAIERLTRAASPTHRCAGMSELVSLCPISPSTSVSRLVSSCGRLNSARQRGRRRDRTPRQTRDQWQERMRRAAGSECPGGLG